MVFSSTQAYTLAWHWPHATGGNGRLVEALLQDVPVRYASVVSRVEVLTAAAAPPAPPPPWGGGARRRAEGVRAVDAWRRAADADHGQPAAVGVGGGGGVRVTTNDGIAYCGEMMASQPACHSLSALD
jgi:hypothetical protein